MRQAEVDGVALPAPVYFGSNQVFQVLVNGDPVPVDQVMVCDIGDVSATEWRRPPATKSYTPSGGGTAVSKPIALSVDPVRGRIAFPAGVNPAAVAVSYVYGFSGDLGAGPYNRSAWLADPSTAPGPLSNPSRWQVAVSRQLAPIPNVLFATLDQAVQAWNHLPAGTDGVIALCDSRTYQENPSRIEIPEGSRLLIVAADWPALRQPLPPASKNLDPDGLRPHLRGQVAVQGTAAGTSQNPGQCFIDGLLIEGGVTVAAGNLGAFGLSHMTIVPSAGVTVASGADANTDNQALAVSLYRTICGPISLGALVPSLAVTDSIVASGPAASPGAAAIAAPGSSLNVQTSTVFGPVGGQILIRRHSETITRERQSHPQAALVEFQQREQFPEDARYVAPVDFIHEQEKPTLWCVASIVAECLEGTCTTPE